MRQTLPHKATTSIIVVSLFLASTLPFWLDPAGFHFRACGPASGAHAPPDQFLELGITQRRLELLLHLPLIANQARLHSEPARNLLTLHTGNKAQFFRMGIEISRYSADS
jgi:hypothetical protein